MLVATADTSLEPRGRVELFLQVCWEVLELNDAAQVRDFGGLEVGSGLLDYADMGVSLF